MIALKFLQSISIFAALAFIVTPAHAESILDIIERNKTIDRPQPPETFDYRYIVNFELEQFEGKDSVMFQARYRVDPNAPSGSRVTIESASDDIYPNSFKDHIEELDSKDYTPIKAASDLWCGGNGDEENDFDFDEIFGEDGIDVISETDNEAVISLPIETLVDKMKFEILSGEEDQETDDETASSDEEGQADNDKNIETANKLVRRLLKRMKSEIVLDKPDGRARRFRMWLPKPMRMMLIAKIKKIDVSFKCDPSPSGFLYKSNQTQEMSVSALGKKVYNKTTTYLEIVSE